MDIGMLWFDDSPRSLKERMRLAAEYYVQKHGQQPTLCLVNPAMLENGGEAIDGIRIRGARSVMRGHFWIGLDDANEKSAKSRAKAAKSRGNGTQSG